MTIIYAILIFCLLIFVHELGHLIAAKSTGIKVNEFAIGMGPKLFGFQKGETLYQVRLLPIGGFCAMEGEDEDSEDPRAFNNRPFWAKAITIVAGSFMNLLLAVILITIIYMYTGMPTTSVHSLVEGSPAAEAGLMAGDSIIAIDGEKVDKWDWTKVQETLAAAPSDTVTLEIERDGSTETIVAGFYEDEQGNQKIGIFPQYERNVGRATIEGVKGIGSMTVFMLKTIGQLFTGEVAVSELSGPVGIVHIVGDTVKVNETILAKVLGVAQLTSLISLNLAIVNMLPIPALDGGRLIFLIVRKFTGKRISDEVEGRIHFVGIILLFGLMIYVTFQDVTKFIL